MDVDTIYESLGDPGRYQVCVYILLCLNYFPVVMNHLVMAFYGAGIPHHCSVPTEEGSSLSDFIPQKYDTLTNTSSLDSCSVYRNQSVYGTNETVVCPQGWQYNSLYGETNIVTQFDLVCDHTYLVGISTTIYFSGVMLGGLLFGALSDRFGRKPFMLITLYCHVVVGVGIAFANSYVLFVLLRFIQGVLMQGLQTSSFVLAMELFVRKHRTVVGTGVELFWGTGVMWLAFLAWLIKDWRYLQLAMCLPSVLAIVYIWLIPESLRWLVTQRKFDKAAFIVKKAAKFNGVKIPEHLLHPEEESLTLIVHAKDAVANGSTDNHGNSEVETVKVQAGLDNTEFEKNVNLMKRYSFLDMFKTPKLRMRSILLFYIWFALALGYYGLSLSLSSLAGNKYLNVFIGGAVEMVAYIVAIFVLNRFGRRRPLMVYFFIGGVFCIIAGAVPRYTAAGVDLGLHKTVLALLGRCGLAGTFSVIFLYTSELYPTVIRNASIGACAFWTRVGGVLAPQILTLGEFTHKSLPIIMFGTMALVAGALTYLLPETMDCKLPDTIEQAEGIQEPVQHSTKTGNQSAGEEHVQQNGQI